MTILVWSTPPKVMSTQEWQAISADSAPPGVYTPNMSRADQERWKAKLFSGANPPRVEVRKTVCGTQVLVIVRASGVRMSMNGLAEFTPEEWVQLHAAVDEAAGVLEDL